MKSDSVLLVICLSLSLILIGASKPPETNRPIYKPKAIGLINKQFKSKLNAWNSQTEAFNSSILHSDSTALINQYYKLREAYKEVEFLVEYLDKEAVDRKLNGAPLPKLEPKVAEHVVLEPQGLQVIDELIASPFNKETLASIKVQAEKLAVATQQIVVFLSNRSLTNRQYFEAARQAIIRVITLGITGFDTPGTLNGITDAQAVMRTLLEFSAPYKEELQNVNNPAIWEQTKDLLKRGIRLTAKGDFEKFDRLYYISQVGNPLLASFKSIHLELGYETIYEVTRFKPAVNYMAENIFQEDFLNPYYYVSIPEDSLINKRAALGKLLFYDPVLSNNNAMSCASCHNPKRAFTDGVPKSISNSGVPLKRNALTLNYSVFATGYFHDMRAKRLEDQFEHVVVSGDEFNTDYNQIKAKLNANNTYLELFKEAFPAQDDALRINNIDYALAAYIMSLNKFDSPLDKYMLGDTKALTRQQQKGFNLFTGKAACATCHFMPLFSGNVPPLFKDSESEVLGVPLSNKKPWKLDSDIGRRGNGMEKEKADFFKNSFKTPTVRNIVLTGPYMHNGVFNSLDEVMEFYNLGGGAGAGMNLPHQTLASDPLDLTQDEIQAIIAFMQALTDGSYFNTPTNIPSSSKELETKDGMD